MGMAVDQKRGQVREVLAMSVLAIGLVVQIGVGAGVVILAYQTFTATFF